MTWSTKPQGPNITSDLTILNILFGEQGNNEVLKRFRLK